MKSIGQCGTSTTVLPTESGPDGRFQDGTPGLESTTATQLIAEFLNSHLEEFANLISDALEEDFSASDDTQILRAINALIDVIYGTASTWTKAQAYTPVALTISSGVVAWDMAAAPVAVLTLDEDVDTITVSNATPGTTPELTVLQNATGGWSCALPAAWLWEGGEGYVVTAAANARDKIMLSVGGTSASPIIDAAAKQDLKAVS